MLKKKTKKYWVYKKNSGAQRNSLAGLDLNY